MPSVYHIVDNIFLGNCAVGLTFAAIKKVINKTRL